MAIDDTDLAGKSGEDLRTSVLQKQTETADATELDTTKQYEVTPQEVQPDELLETDKYNIATTTAPDAGTIDSTAYTQEAPDKVTPASYDASTVGDVGGMTAASGTVSDKSVIDAAQGTLSTGAIAEAQTQELDQKATVSYQLGELFKSIGDGTELPAWAAPTVRKASAIMAQRGLGSSSMASAAIVQAIYEAGVPIASADANKYAAIQLQNLSNQQQTTLQNAVTTASMDTANLNNRQLAAVNNAKSFLTLDLQNLTNEQASSTLNFQTKVSSLFTDNASSNAAKAFNAKTQNEVDQFFAELETSVESSTLNRKAAQDQYNISQKVAVDQFNAQMTASREQFNSNARQQIDQSNAVWRRGINTSNTAAQNAVNQQNVQTLLGLTQTAQNNLWQLYKDQATWTMSTSENNIDRAHNAAMQSAAINANADQYDSKFDDFLIVKTIDNIF